MKSTHQQTHATHRRHRQRAHTGKSGVVLLTALGFMPTWFFHSIVAYGTLSAVGCDTGAAVVSASFPCMYSVPDLPAGTSIDPSVAALISQSASGEITTIPRASGPDACAAGGFYLDDPVAPTAFVTCHSTCEALRADPGVAVRATIGCVEAS